jgi:hypothetical protein
MDPITTAAVVAGAHKLLGKTVDAIAEDFAKLYAAGRDKIIATATRKTDTTTAGQVNLRVARDVFWNGSFTDEAICAEYFGGILAGARTEDGTDDHGIFYLDIMKGLSASQLHLHYIIYYALNNLWLKMPSEMNRPNPGMMNELQKYPAWFAAKEIEQLGIDIGQDLIALHNKGLIGDAYEAKGHPVPGNKELRCMKTPPTTLGIQIYAAAYNKIKDWPKLPHEDFGSFPDIPLPKYFSFSFEELLNPDKGTE